MKGTTAVFFMKATTLYIEWQARQKQKDRIGTGTKFHDT